jgi:hypothetical protein
VNVLPIPDGPWVERLRRRHRIYLFKEGCEASVEWPYQPPEPGCVAGEIAIRKILYNHFQPTIEVWYVYPDGRGFDGKQLIAPIEGNLPENPPPIPEPWRIKVERQLEHLADAIDKLQQRVYPPPLPYGDLAFFKHVYDGYDDVEKEVK